MSNSLRFGILGATSDIARKAVIPAINAVEDVEVLAAASRSRPDALQAPHVYDDYGALLADPDVDAVYNPLPNHLHAEWTIKAAVAGKHVLCEKPLATSEGEARRMVDACTQAGVMLMEAYVSPYHPRNSALMEWITSGALGHLRHGHARFTGTMEPGNHRWHPEQGGGALLDTAIYCLEPLLTAAEWDGHQAVTVAAHQTHGGHGVDATFSGWLVLNGVSLSFVCSFEAPARQLLEFVGTQASVDVEGAFTPERGEKDFTAFSTDGRQMHHETGTGDGYEGMVADFASAIAEGRPLRRGPDRSTALLRVIDELREAADA